MCIRDRARSAQRPYRGSGQGIGDRGGDALRALAIPAFWHATGAPDFVDALVGRDDRRRRGPGQLVGALLAGDGALGALAQRDAGNAEHRGLLLDCLLYTSDAADERSSVDLG